MTCTKNEWLYFNSTLIINYISNNKVPIFIDFDDGLSSYYPSVDGKFKFLYRSKR